MDKDSIPDFLRSAADAELARLQACLPTGREQRFILFLEVQRILDTACVQHAFGTSKEFAHHQELDILRWGMNLATSNLFVPQGVRHALPLMKTSDALRNAARNILWNFGAISLARRTADMVQYGFMLAERDGKSITLRDSGTGLVQYMDNVEFDLLRRAEVAWAKKAVAPQGWTMCEQEELEVKAKLKTLGSFYSRPTAPHEPLLSPEELEKIMVPLIHPWTIPQGTMMGYGATEEIDEHFIVEASLALEDFRSDAGIHANVDFGAFSGADVLKVTTVLLSLFRKHVVFGLFAHKHFPDISIRESFTIWGPREDLVDSLCVLTHLPRKRVNAVLKGLTLTASDMTRLQTETTPLLPMLIDLGNGFYLRPVSSLTKNPLVGFQKISRWRNPSTRNQVSASRESWFRQEVYSLFGGSRYLCVSGSIVLRVGNRRLTDIDAAVFDRTNGELALFQLKWQDYSTNSIKELRSKASNLASELDTWGERVKDWLSVTPPDRVTQALRMKLNDPEQITAIFFFGISRTVARTHGYGFPVSNPFLSIASWPQFRRIRGQIGPAPAVFSKLHEVLRTEESLTLTDAKPQPATLELPGFRMHFKDLWNIWDNSESEDGLVSH